MSHNTTTDIVEEDAADLQFPKDMSGADFNPCITSSNYQNSINDRCKLCKMNLMAPFIHCTECDDFEMCCECFANGLETAAHKNDHAYKIMTDNFCLFENTEWTAGEEKQLLNAISECGYGNWTGIANRVRTRSAAECKYHYETFYIDRPGSELLPKFPETETSMFGCAPIPYNLKTYGVEDPPRHGESSPSFETMAGYNAARSDFNFPYDSSAESVIGDLNNDAYERLEDDQKDELIEELQCAAIRAYNNRLKERQRRMWVVKEHGLILHHKQLSMINRCQGFMPIHVVERFQGYMQLLSGIEFDFTMESLCRSIELRRHLLRLGELRSRGIRTFYGANLFRKLSHQREINLRDLQNFINRPELQYNQTENEKNNVASVPNRRSVAPPLDIVGLPGYERLSDDERMLCSTVRLVPESYLEFKNILISEAKKFDGSLRLLDARKLIRIDVNKTRKLYDFLIKSGHIGNPKVPSRPRDMSIPNINYDDESKI